MSGISMYHREMEERRRWGQFHKSGVYYHMLHGRFCTVGSIQDEKAACALLLILDFQPLLMTK